MKRREFLKLAGAGGVGVALGATGLKAAEQLTRYEEKTETEAALETLDPYNSFNSLIVTGAGDSAVAPAVAPVAARLQYASRNRFAPTMAKLDVEVTPADRVSYNLIVIGRPETNSLAAELEAKYGKMEISEGHIRIKKFKDGFAPGREVILLTGSGDHEVREAAHQWSVETYLDQLKS